MNSLGANPATLVACALDDFAAAWAQRLMRPVAELARRRPEPDHVYRPRLLGLIEEFVNARCQLDPHLR